MKYKNSRGGWKTIVRVLARSVVIDTAYQRLALAVIGQALSDLTDNDRDIRERTGAGIRQGCLVWWCDHLGVEHDFLLRLIDDAGLMPVQERRVSHAA
ncbi:MAG: hypothetical protein OQK24_15070 [Magnetovibrio sp.]|nr:hypothetical protein [Magnetovibrio sp.]